MKNVCLSILLGIALSTVQASVIPVDPATNVTTGEIGIRGYFTVYASATHAVAQQNCRDLYGGRLAVVLTSGQSLDLQNFIATQNPGTHYRIGGMKMGSSWMWTSVSNPLPVTIPGWKPGQPGSSTGCMCANGIGSGYGWYVCSCSSSYYYICEA